MARVCQVARGLRPDGEGPEPREQHIVRGVQQCRANTTVQQQQRYPRHPHDGVDRCNAEQRDGQPANT